jgi:hypothetical protein
MESTWSSETLVDFYWTTRNFIPKDWTCNRWREFDNSELRRIFEPEKGEVVGELQLNIIMVKKSSEIDGRAM